MKSGRLGKVLALFGALRSATPWSIPPTRARPSRSPHRPGDGPHTRSLESGETEVGRQALASLVTFGIFLRFGYAPKTSGSTLRRHQARGRLAARPSRPLADQARRGPPSCSGSFEH